MSRRRLSSCITVSVALGILATALGCTPSKTAEVGRQETSTSAANPTLEPTPVVTAPPSETPTEKPSPTPEPVMLLNPGFEDQDASGVPTGWSNLGAMEASYLEGNGHSGDFRLTHGSSEVYQVETSQAVSGLEDGWYTLRAWIRSSGGQTDVYAALQCAGSEKRVHIPSTSPGYRWIQVVVSNQVTDGACTIRFYSEGNPDTWASFDDIELVPGRAVLSILGADISSLKKSEDKGGVYREADGTPGDALDILKAHGMNYARLRVWVDPADGYHGKSELLEMARRLKDAGMQLLVDFHYSDSWADPGKQVKPAAWEDYDVDGLAQAVYDHTYDVCSSLVDQGTPPAMVQVGNEINAGMLWPDGDYNHFDNLAAMLKEGYRAVKDCSSSTLVMLHIAEGGDNELARWWFGNIVRRDVPFDLIGISYYPFWHGTLGQLQYNLNDITERYDKDVIVVETAYPFTDQDKDAYPNIAESSMAIPDYPFTPEGQRTMLRDVMGIVRAVPDGRGVGVFWWDATWTAVPGNGWDPADPSSGNAWENQALFDFNDRVLPALDEFLDP